MKRECEEFEVVGAGSIRVGKTSTAICGGRAGFTLDASWGSNGFSGGVLPQAEARRLAEYILSTLTKYADEETIIADFNRRIESESQSA